MTLKVYWLFLMIDKTTVDVNCQSIVSKPIKDLWQPVHFSFTFCTQHQTIDVIVIIMYGYFFRSLSLSTPSTFVL